MRLAKYLVLFWCLCSYMGGDIAHAAINKETTDFHTGIKIVWDIPDDELITLTEVDWRDRRRTVETIKSELKKYPKSLLNQIIKSIYLSKTAMTQGLHVGGVARWKPDQKKGDIYLTSWKSSKDELRRILHHEIGHYLMYLRGFESIYERWLATNPEGFEYVGSSLDAIRQGHHAGGNKTLYEQGFISSYSQASLSEDFAEISAHIFIGKRNFWRLTDDYPRLKQKTLLVIELLKGVDPKYSERHLRYRW